MVTISQDVTKELIAVMHALNTKKSLDVPTHTMNGEKIQSLESLCEIMGVPESIAIKAVLEQKEHPLQLEAKIRNVRNAEYWGHPVGTPITEAMRRAREARDRAGTAARSATRRTTPSAVVRANRQAAAPGTNESLLGARRKRLWRITPRGAHMPGRGGGMEGGGGDGFGGGGGGIGGFGGFGALSGLTFTKGGVPKGARKIGEVNGAFADGTRGKAARYVTKLKNGKNETWLLLSRYDKSGKLVKEQTAKVRPGFADKQWGSIARALKP